jgi:hypothetical protein
MEIECDSCSTVLGIGEVFKVQRHCAKLESCTLVVTDAFDKCVCACARARVDGWVSCIFTWYVNSTVISVCRRINFVISMQLGAMKMKLNMAAVTVRCASHAEDIQGH